MFALIHFQIDDYECVYPTARIKSKHVGDKEIQTVKWENKVNYEVHTLAKGDKSAMNELLRSRRTTVTNDKLQTPIISKGTQQEQIPVDTDKDASSPIINIQHNQIDIKQQTPKKLSRHPAFPLTPRIALVRNVKDVAALSSSPNQDRKSTDIKATTGSRPRREHSKRGLFSDTTDNANINEQTQNNCFEKTNTDTSAETSESSASYLPSSQQKGKLYFCIYCKCTVKKFARHLERNHQSEENVKQFIALPKKSKERLDLIEQIRNKGTFLYNTTLHNKTKLIVSRRPRYGTKKSDQDYLPCPKCKGFYSKFSLRKHLKKCGVCLGRQIQSTCKSLLETNLFSMNDIMRTNILPKLKSDKITEIVKNDSLILSYGSLLCRKYVTKKHLDKHIRNKLRILGRFVIAATEINPKITDLSMCIDPTYFDNVIAAINKIAKYDLETRTYKLPSLATITGSTLKQCAQKVLANAIRSDVELKEKAKCFVELYDIEFGSLVASTAVENITQSKWNKSIELPSISDIQKLHHYLDKQSEYCFSQLEINGFNYSLWNSLMSHVLVKIMVFNRKRSGEIEKLLISQYNKRQRIEANSDSFKTLLSEEQRLSQQFVRIEIRGKLGRRVPILLRDEHVNYINKILSMREEAGVISTNIYVFGKKDNHLSACKELRSIASLCGATRPELLRGTYLRKQIATISQTMNLTENDVQLLADFMGHDLNIHKAHYRKSELALQTGKISKLLLASEDPEIEEYRGKNLDTLSVSVQGNTNVSDTNVGTSDLTETNTTTPKKKKLISLHRNTCRKNVVTTDSKKIVRRTWRTPEKVVMRRRFSHYLEMGTLPTMLNCINAIKEEPSLKYRTPDQVKAWINNQNNLQARRQLF